MMMQLNRDHTFVSKIGPSIQFHKNKPTYVPAKFVTDIIGLGGEVAETDQQEAKNAMALIAQAQLDADAKAPKIEAAIRKMVERNTRGDFTAGGEPNLNTLAKLLGDVVAREEMAPVWAKIKAEL